MIKKSFVNFTLTDLDARRRRNRTVLPLVRSLPTALSLPIELPKPQIRIPTYFPTYTDGVLPLALQLISINPTTPFPTYDLTSTKVNTNGLLFNGDPIYTSYPLVDPQYFGDAVGSFPVNDLPTYVDPPPTTETTAAPTTTAEGLPAAAPATTAEGLPAAAPAGNYFYSDSPAYTLNQDYLDAYSMLSLDNHSPDISLNPAYLNWVFNDSPYADASSGDLLHPEFRGYAPDDPYTLQGLEWILGEEGYRDYIDGMRRREEGLPLGGGEGDGATKSDSIFDSSAIAPTGVALGVGGLAGALMGGNPLVTAAGTGIGALGGHLLWKYLSENLLTQSWINDNLWDGAGEHMLYIAPALGGLAGLFLSK